MKFIENKFRYDKDNDILYYTNGDKSNSYGDEEPDNIVFMRDIDTDVVTGITVLDFARMCKKNDSRIKVLYQYFNVKLVFGSIDNL